MKNILLILVTLFLSSCVATKNGNTKTLKLEKAEAVKYVLGTRLSNGKTSGKTYSMYFKNNGSAKVQKVWINGKNIDFEQQKTNAEGSFRVRSTFYDVYKKNVHENVKAPIEYVGQGLIQYKEGEEIKYYIIKEFTELKKVYGK